MSWDGVGELGELEDVQMHDCGGDSGLVRSGSVYGGQYALVVGHSVV